MRPLAFQTWPGGLAVSTDSFASSLSYSECKVRLPPACVDLPAFSDLGSMHTLLWMPAALDLVLSCLVTVALKSFLWQLCFFMSSHPMPSQSCPDQCTMQAMPFTTRECLGHLSPEGHAQVPGHRAREALPSPGSMLGCRKPLPPGIMVINPKHQVAALCRGLNSLCMVMLLRWVPWGDVTLQDFSQRLTAFLISF